ncbi:MAG: histidine kinase [Deltaproteobacteria bacterium]|nr:histidine kinase [Deltaproteobacteria bacterium]
MWNKLTLRGKVMGMLGTLMALTLLGGAVLIGYTYRIEDLFLEVTEKELLAYQSAEALATSLVNQKGFVSYYFMDGDPDWLRQLGEYRQIFKGRLKEARIYSEDENERSLLDTIARENRRFVQTQDIVISHYEAGQRKAGETLHHEARKDFFQILEHCAFYKDLRKEKIMGAKEANQALARRLRISAVSGIMAFLLVGFLLAAFLIREILQPIRRLALETGEPEQSVGSKNVVQSLSLRIHDLVQDYNQTSVHLEKSRAHLLQAEKMAMVGKLAAGMAHSIRNPFTSVQMRLFSLKRSLEMDPVQQEDFDVIAEEIQHIDTIVQNFLEFSRTPKMKIQTVSPSTIVDNTLQLLKHRLNSYDVTVKLTREEPLPKVQADSEQIKEVLINIIINACEVMNAGGSITICEEAVGEPGEQSAVIHLTDDGPGMPAAVSEKVFDPFFTTKEEGTGLGLSIVKRIIEEHGGSVSLVSSEGGGTTFTIDIPVEGGIR